MTGTMRMLCAMLVLVPAAAGAADGRDNTRPELAVGVLAHGVNLFDHVPAGLLLEGTEERDTADLELVWRSRPMTKALKPRLTAKLQLNTGGRTSFASVGAEWRQHVLRGRIYGQIGIGLTVHNGYRFTPDPFAPGLSLPEFLRRADLYQTRTSFGSRVLFNPNLSLGVRLDRRWAVEVAFEHYSHKRVFSQQNPGIDTIGLRLVRTFGR